LKRFLSSLFFLFFDSFYFNMGPYIYKKMWRRLSFACHPHSHAAARGIMKLGVHPRTLLLPETLLTILLFAKGCQN